MERELITKLASQLRAKRTTTDRFRINLSADECAYLLEVAYSTEVSNRGGVYIPTDYLTAQIRAISGVLTASNCQGGIILSGVCGTGKTTVVSALAKVVAKLSECGICSMTAGLAIYRSKDLMRHPDKVEEAMTRPLICIDDLGAEAGALVDYGNRLTPIRDIIETRYDKQLFTIFTTNLTPSQIREKYGDRIADRFNEMVVPIVFSGKSFRKQHNFAK